MGDMVFFSDLSESDVQMYLKHWLTLKRIGLRIWANETEM